MAISADRVIVELEAKLDKYSVNLAQALRQFEKAMRDIQQSADRAEKKTTDAFDNMGSSAGTNASLISRAGVMIAASAAAMAAGFIAAATAAINYGAKLSDLSRQSGLSVEQLQILQRAGIDNGFTMDQAANAVERLSQKLGDAKSNLQGETARAFRSIGITDEQITSLRTGADLLPVIADRIREFGTEAEQATAAQRAGLGDLLPLLRQGSQGYEQYAEQARNAGLVTQEQADRAREARDRLGQLAQTIQTNLASALLDILPYLENIASALVSVASAAGWALDQLNRLSSIDIGGISVGGILSGRAGIERAFANATPEQRQAFLAAARGQSGGAGSLDYWNRRGWNTGNRRLGSTERPRGGGSRTPVDTTERFERELDRLNVEILRARAAMATNEEDRLELMRQLDSEEYDARLNQIQRIKATTEQQRQAQARAIEALSRLYGRDPDGTIRSDGLISQATNREGFARIARERMDLELAALDAETEALRIADQLADTQEERRVIQTQLLDAEIRRLQVELDAIPAHEEANRALAQARLDSARAIRGQNIELIRRATMGPGEAYLEQIRRTGAAMNEATQQVAVSGLQNLNDELAEAVTGFLKLGGVAGRVANQIISDMLRIAIQQQLIRPLANALFGGGGALFGGSAPLPKFASGGSFKVGGRAGIDQNVLSINGEPRAMVSGNEIINVVPQARSFGATPNLTGDSASQTGLVKVQLSLPDDLNARIVEVSTGVAVEVTREAAPQIMSQAKADTLRSITRPRL
jgi:hypothetical protein